MAQAVLDAMVHGLGWRKVRRSRCAQRLALAEDFKHYPPANGILVMQRKRAIAIAAQQQQALQSRLMIAAALLLLPALLLLLISP